MKMWRNLLKSNKLNIGITIRNHIAQTQSHTWTVNKFIQRSKLTFIIYTFIFNTNKSIKILISYKNTSLSIESFLLFLLQIRNIHDLREVICARYNNHVSATVNSGSNFNSFVEKNLYSFQLLQLNFNRSFLWLMHSHQRGQSVLKTRQNQASPGPSTRQRHSSCAH